MSRKSLLIALGLSLLFNVFVLVGFVTKSEAPASSSTSTSDNKPSVSKVASELQLTDDQAKLLAELREDHRQQATVFDESLALVQQGMVAELRKENPDLTKLRSLVEQEAELYRQRRLAGADLYGKFVGKLDPQQRRKLVGRVPHGPHGPIPRVIMERFDRNHNGRLDPDEYQDARQEMEKRRRDTMHGAPPPRMPSWRQFDANHDGIMDAQELAAMDEFQQQQQQQQRDREREQNERDRNLDFSHDDAPPPPQSQP
jgi:hypothetical protein